MVAAPAALEGGLGKAIRLFEIFSLCTLDGRCFGGMAGWFWAGKDEFKAVFGVGEAVEEVEASAVCSALMLAKMSRISGREGEKKSMCFN